MDSLPPNDPNNNRPNSSQPTKEAPYDGSRRGRQTDTDGRMDVIGDLQDSPAVVAMFVVGVLSWFLRERCVC